MASDDVWLVELTGYTDVAASTVYRYATRGYITPRTDSPPEVYYEELVRSPGTISRQLFADGTSGAQANPRTECAYGAITLANIHGALDAVFDNAAISFRERPVRVLRVQQGQPYSTAVLVMAGVISQVSLSRDEVTVGIKDALYLLASPHITTLYGGTNALPNGVDGVAELNGKARPLIYGKVFQIAPPCVNTSRLEYQVSTAAVQSGTVYDGGVALTNGATYANQAAMEATAPAAGQARWWLGGGMFRLGSTPAKRITADVVADTSGNSTAAQILKRMALDRGVASGDISAADVSAMDALNSAVCGIYIDDQTNTLDLMDQIARSAGMYYGMDRLGLLRMGRFDLPSGAALATVAYWNCSAVERQANGEDVPTTTLRLKYARYYQAQDRGSLAGAVTDAQASDYAQAYRVATYTDTLSPNPHRRTLTAERETLFTAKADADAEALRLYGITSAPRRTHIVKDAQLDDAALAALDINAVIGLRWSRYGFSVEADTLRRVIAIVYDYAAGRADLTVWGP